MIGKLLGYSGIETTARYTHLAHDSSHDEALGDPEKFAFHRILFHLDRCDPPPIGASRSGQRRNTGSCQPLYCPELPHLQDSTCAVRKMYHTLDMAPSAQDTDLRSRLLARMAASPDEVWTPGDFADLGSRAAVDKTLQRLVAAGGLRRVDRGLYDQPRTNELTARPTIPDYRAVIRAVTRRDQARAVIDGMTAANDLGFTTAVPARIEVLVDARLKPIKLGNQEIHFKFAAPSRLYWAGRPAMRVVQALHWMQDMLTQDSERHRVQEVLSRMLADPRHGQAIRDDLRAGLPALPIWMQEFLRGLLNSAGTDEASQ